MDIVVDVTLVTAATVILAFIVNQGAAWAGLELSTLAKKLVVFVVAVALTGYAAVHQGSLPLPTDDPMALAAALLAYSTAVFKAAQPVFDKIWTGLLNA